MPGENVSFVAFGQGHKDKAAMEAVKEQLTALYKDLKSQNKTLILGVEHSEGDVRDASAIRELHNRAVMQIYLEKTPNPSLQDFLKTSGSQLITKEQHPEMRAYTETSEIRIASLYSEQSKVWGNDVNRGRGEARLVEAAILDWADLNKVKVSGLDPVPDSQKSDQLTHGTGLIDGKALKSMEYERVQGMGKKSAEIMKGLAATEGGGCLVAINMGQAHLGSVEVALRDALKTEGLGDARVTMCVMVPPDRLKENRPLAKVAEDLMYESVKDMRQTQPMKEAVSCLSSLNMARTKLDSLETVLKRVESLPSDEREFYRLLNEDPGKVTEVLDPDGVNKKGTGKLISAAKAEVSQSEHEGTGARAFIVESLQVRPEDLKEARESLELSRQDLETALTKLTPQEEEALYFSEKVNERLAQQPNEVFKILKPGENGSYNLKDLGLIRKTSVGESLGMKGSSSVTPLSPEQQHGVNQGVTDSSTRSQLKRSGSLTKPGGDSTTSHGTTPQKHVLP